MPAPLLPWQVCNGSTYWAAKGDTKWSAVRILKVLRVKADVERVIPRSQKIIHRKGKVRLDELVKRDPKLKGKDKPTAPPAEVFKQVRELREEETQVAETVPEPAPEPEATPPAKKPTLDEEAARRERVSRLFELLADDSTDDDW